MALVAMLAGASGLSAEEATVTVVFAGDTSFGESYHERIAAGGGPNLLAAQGYDHAIAAVGPLLARADLAIVNLETPLTERRVSPLLGKTFTHHGNGEETTAMLSRYGVDAVALANNHALDYGLDGLLDTVASLDAAGIGWFGAGDSAADAAAALVRRVGVGDDAVTVAVIGAFERDALSERWGVYAEHGLPGVRVLDPASLAAQLTSLRAARPEAFIAVFPHWGYDHWWRNETQMEIAHHLIDAGADIVIGHGAHVMQEIEHYRGKWILYGLGDFVLGAPIVYADPAIAPFSLVAELEIATGAQPTLAALKLYPILTDNAATGYQPRFLDDVQFSEAAARLFTRSGLTGEVGRFRADRDELGPFIHVDVRSDAP